MNRRTERRRFPRRSKSVRVWFEHDGDHHNAVTTIVSLGGAFLKSSHLPPPGTVLTLHERFKSGGGAVSLRCEVIWLLDSPNLERPDTGFGVRFIEAFTRADPSALEELLTGLSPTPAAFEITLEERAHGAYSVYRFQEECAPTSAEIDELGELDDLAVIDLDRELARLGLEEPLLAPAPEVAPKRLDPTPVPLPRSRRKRRITGLFTALFSRQRSTADGARPEVRLIWEDSVVSAHVEAIGEHGASVIAASAPSEGTQLIVRPALAPAPLDDLFVLAQVERRQQRLDGALSLSLAFVRVDEGGQPGRFQEYLRFIHGER